MTFSTEVAHEGLFHFTARMMKARRESLPRPCLRYAPSLTVLVPECAFPQSHAVPFTPVKPLRVVTVDSLDDGEEIEVSPDDPQEVGAAFPSIQAGDDFEVELEELEVEEGAVSDDVVTVDE